MIELEDLTIHFLLYLGTTSFPFYMLKSINKHSNQLTEKLNSCMRQ